MHNNLALNSPILFSSRRSRRSARSSRGYRQGSQQTSLPDWVWGVGIGSIILVVIGGFLLFSGVMGGGGGGGCGKALPPLPGNVQVSAEGFNQEDASVGKVIDYLNKGDLDNAFANFYGDTHAFTHNIDPQIRGVNETLAISLCEAVLDIEGKLDPPPGTSRSPSAMSASATKLRNQLRDVSVALGYPRPGG